MKDFFDNIIASIGINDVLDILIVSFIVYKILGKRTAGISSSIFPVRYSEPVCTELDIEGNYDTGRHCFGRSISARAAQGIRICGEKQDCESAVWAAGQRKSKNGDR